MGWMGDRKASGESGDSPHLIVQSALPRQTGHIQLWKIKIQIIAGICDQLVEVFQEKVNHWTLAITGADRIQCEVQNGTLAI